MKKIILILFLLITSNLFSQDFTFSKEQRTLIDTNIAVFPEHSELAFAIIKNGEVFYYGIKKENGVYVPVSNHQSVFEIGSITKVFTSMLMTQLHLEKKIDMNRPVRKYLKLKFNEKSNFTFVHLSNHTSGLPRLPHNLLPMIQMYPQNPYVMYGEKELEYYLKKQLTTMNKVGEVSSYSNLGCGLLAYTLSKIEEKSYEQLLQEHIFKKLSMENSTTERPKVESLLIKGRNKLGDTVPNWDLKALAGAGAILSNVSDMVKFALYSMENNQVNELMQQETIAINSNLGVGLGWHIFKNTEGKQVLWHNGATGGYSSSMCVDVESKNAVIILSNINSENLKKENLDVISLQLLRTLQP